MDSSLTIYQLTILLTLLSKPNLDATYDQLLSKTKSITPRGRQTNKHNLEQALKSLAAKNIASSDDRVTYDFKMHPVNVNFNTSSDRHTPQPLSLDVQQSTLHWHKLSHQQKDHQIGVFATALFRTLISNITLLTQNNFNNNEILSFTTNTLSHPLLKTLDLVSTERKVIFIETVRNTVLSDADRQSIRQPRFYISHQFPALWAYETPSPGPYQMGAILAIAEVLRLHQTTGLIGISNLAEFGNFMNFIAK